MPEMDAKCYLEMNSKVDRACRFGRVWPVEDGWPWMIFDVVVT